LPRSRILIIAALAAVIGTALGISALLWIQSSSEISSPVKLEGFSICPSNCGYPSPFIEGTIAINYPSPWIRVEYFVNGACPCPIANFTNTSPVVLTVTKTVGTNYTTTAFTESAASGGSYDYIWKETSPIPIIANDAYKLTFILWFGNGKNFTVSTVVTAYSN
jgi:hypothetical protein